MKEFRRRIASVVDVSGTADAARLGAWLMAFQGLIIALTAQWLQDGDGLPVSALTLAAGLMTAGLISRRLPWARWSPITLAAFPLTAFTIFAAIGLTAPSSAPAYISLITLWFMYVGVTAPLHTGMALLLPAMGTWVLMQQTIGPQHVVRLVLASATWAVLADVLALRAAVVRVRTDDLAHQAETDALTGLPNRRTLESSLGRLAAGDVVLVIDLDHFKAINDTGGHDYGDQILVEFGHTLSSAVRGSDLVARYGGEEFVLLLRSGDRQGLGAAAVVARLRGNWSQLNPGITWSAGASCHQDGADPHATLREADRALYRAKAAGRGRVLASGDARELLGVATASAAAAASGETAAKAVALQP